MPYTTFDVSRLRLKPLAERANDMSLSDVLEIDAPRAEFRNEALRQVAQSVLRARENGRPVILMMGAHVIKVGLSRFIIDLIEKDVITHVAGNGACAIHDYELALIGATTESVANYIRVGEFGLWAETGRVNELARIAAGEDIGFGEAVGREIQESGFQHADVSIYAAAYRKRVPATVHVSLGYDIIHQHPGFDAAATGSASYTDFLVFTESVSHLEGGVLLNVGSAVMGPEVYLKALSMVRNVASQEGRSVSKFTTAVFDMIELGTELTSEAPKSDPRYYYRPFKTILVRTVRDGGESHYVCGDHVDTIPELHRLVMTTPNA